MRGEKGLSTSNNYLKANEIKSPSVKRLEMVSNKVRPEEFIKAIWNQYRSKIQGL